MSPTSPLLETPDGVSRYSWYQVVTDGPVRAPRWVHHIAIKLCTQHTAPAFLLWVLTGRPLLATLIAGPGVYAYIIATKLWHRAPRNYPDWVHDAALAITPVAGGLMASGHWIAGLVELAVCVLIWRQFHQRAIP